MSATTTPTTFVDLYTDVLNRVRASTTDTTSLNLARRYLNSGLHDLHIQQNWPWAERRAVVITHDTYTAGSISIASTSRAALVGTNTAWNTAISGLSMNNTRVGGKVMLAGEQEAYLISGVTSDTAATIDSSYVGSPAVASAYAVAYKDYTYFEDEYALAADFWRLVDLRKFTDALPIEVLSRQEFYRRYPRPLTASTPQVCTILELGPSGSTALRPRVVFSPPPDDVLQIPYRYITTNLAMSSGGTGAANLSADADEPIVPLRYRHVLIFWAVAQWYRDRKDDARAQEATSEYVDLVKRMAGDSLPERDHPRFQSPRSRYLAGAAGPRRWSSGGFSTGSRVDELRDR